MYKSGQIVGVMGGGSLVYRILQIGCLCADGQNSFENLFVTFKEKEVVEGDVGLPASS
jgi:hypothetical protein